MSSPLTFVDERISNSITSLIPASNAVDQLQPLSFTEWLKYNNQTFTTTNEFLARYKSYLTNWYKAKNISYEKADNEIVLYYKNLINDIVINYSTNDERRYLKNIDLSDNRDLAVAVPFFAQKIKEICIYYSTLRDDVTTTVTNYNLKGSNTGIEKLLYETLTKTIQAQDFKQQFSTFNTTASALFGNMIVDVEDLYDLYPDYYDLSPTLPASAYNANADLRADLFESNVNDVDPLLYINRDQSILKAILTYPFYLIELEGHFTIDPLVNSTQLDLLKDGDFITGVNDGDTTNLNINAQAAETTKYIGADFYYIVTNNTQTEYTSGQLFTADSEFANILNKRFPSLASIPSSEFLKTGKEIGLFFKPDKIGLLQFTNFNFSFEIDVDKLQPNTIYYFPDPYKYGNVSGSSKVDFTAPIKFFEQNHFNKIDHTNQYRFGDVDTHPYYQTFRAYQTREQTLDYSNDGVSRYTDSQDFFTGKLDNIWNNLDVYPQLPINQYPIEQRYGSLLPINKTLFQFKNDIYGNEYGLYKSAVNKQLKYREPEPQNVYVILDGAQFSTTNNTYNTSNSALGYSGVTINTPTFTYFAESLTIASYDFAPDIRAVQAFQSLVPVYICFVKDCMGFTKPNNDLLPDVPSDQSSYNPNNSTLYYTELADGSVNVDAPYGVPNFSYESSFLTDTLQYVNEDYDGNAFIVGDNEEPCGKDIYTHSYTQASNFKDIRIPGYQTLIDLSLSGKDLQNRTLYYTRNIETGTLYVRNSNSTTIGPVSSILSSVFIKYPAKVKEEIQNNIINFDLYYDTLQFETENYTVFDRVGHDYDTNEIIGSTRAYNIIERGDQRDLEQISNAWLDEKEKTLYINKTTLLRDVLSGSNYKAIYPTMYKVELDTGKLTQIYPTTNTSDLKFSALSAFSLYGRNIELNITTIEKPVLSYNPETGFFNMTYLAKDASGIFYITTIKYRYANNQILNLTCTMHKPSTDVYSINFANPQGNPELDIYTILGRTAGTVQQSEGTFTFGRGLGDTATYDSSLWQYIQQAGVSDYTARQQLSAFTEGLKDLNVWDNTICWLLPIQFNGSTDSTVYSLGGYGNYNANTVRVPIRTTQGMIFQKNRDQYIYTSNIPALVEPYTIFDIAVTSNTQATDRAGVYRIGGNTVTRFTGASHEYPGNDDGSETASIGNNTVSTPIDNNLHLTMTGLQRTFVDNNNNRGFTIANQTNNSNYSTNDILITYSSTAAPMVIGKSYNNLGFDIDNQLAFNGTISMVLLLRATEPTQELYTSISTLIQNTIGKSFGFTG